VLEPDEVPVEGGGADVGHHRPPGRHLVAAGGDDGHRPAAPHHDPGHPGAAQEPPTPGFEPGDQRRRQPPGTPLGDGEADLLPQAAQQPPEEARGRAVGGQVGVEGGAGEQQPRPLPRELLLGQALHRQHPEAGEARHPGRAEPGGEAGSGPDRRERRQEGVEQRPADPSPQAVEAPPGVAVAGGKGGEGGGGLVEVGREHRAAPVRQRVGQRQRRAAPAEAVALELQPGEDGRRRPERVEGAEPVVEEAGERQLAAADGAAGVGLRFEDHDAPPGVGQQVGGHEAVGPGPDDNRVGVAGHGAVLPMGTCAVCQNESVSEARRRGSSPSTGGAH